MLIFIIYSYFRLLNYVNWPKGLFFAWDFLEGVRKSIQWKKALRDPPPWKRKCSARLKAKWIFHQLYLLYDFSFWILLEKADDSDVVLEFWAERIYSPVLCNGNWLGRWCQKQAWFTNNQEQFQTTDRSLYIVNSRAGACLTFCSGTKTSVLIYLACFFPQPEGWSPGRWEP